MKQLVSQSEADTFLACEYKHYYAFGEALQPRQYSPGLSRGIFGHGALNVYYDVLKEGGSIRNADQAMMIWCKNEMLTAVNNNDERGMSAINQVLPRLKQYSAEYRYEMEEWEILTVEHEFRNGKFPFKPDLVKRHRKTKDVVVMDHKFLYNFYTDDEIRLLPQLPKYVGALREMGYRVTRAEYNMIRWRENAAQKFKRLRLDIPEARIERYLLEQDRATDRIRSLRSLDLEDWKDHVQRSASTFNCKNCSFKTLCQSDLDNLHGRANLVRGFYEPNTYGYSESDASDE